MPRAQPAVHLQHCHCANLRLQSRSSPSCAQLCLWNQLQIRRVQHSSPCDKIDYTVVLNLTHKRAHLAKVLPSGVTPRPLAPVSGDTPRPLDRGLCCATRVGTTAGLATLRPMARSCPRVRSSGRFCSRSQWVGNRTASNCSAGMFHRKCQVHANARH